MIEIILLEGTSMLAFHRSWSKKVSTEIILSACVLLIGVVILYVGYYRNNNVILDIGFFILLSGVFSEIFFIFVAGKT
jgi:hypothetical protein